MTLNPPKPTLTIVTTFLPGPDRKRTFRPYHFRVTYRNPEPNEPGCAMTWEVLGGREPYQISLEKLAARDCRWYCSCADAVYRGEDDPGHICKHVQGLLDTLPAVGAARQAA